VPARVVEANQGDHRGSPLRGHTALYGPGGYPQKPAQTTCHLPGGFPLPFAVRFAIIDLNEAGLTH